MRRSIQLIFLAGFTLLFFLSPYAPEFWNTLNFFFQLDPLLVLGTILTSKKIVGTLVLSLLLLALTLVIGRFSCGYLCPLGVLLDLFSKNEKNNRNLKANLGNIKHYILIIIVASAATGFSIFYLFDPLMILSRFYAFLVYPLLTFFTNLILDIIRPLAYLFDWTGISYRSYRQPLFYMNFITLLTFGAVIALNLIRPRFWCRFLCPLGALLCLFSRFGLIKREVSDKCNNCLLCRDNCPMEAIGDDPKNYRITECIQCQQCTKICPEEAISFKPRFSFLPQINSRIDLPRRNLLLSLAGGLGLSFLVATRPSVRLRSKKLIRPPGAIPEEDFLDTCIRCGECMNACPTNTLQPSLREAGLEGLWTPRMDLRYAGCEQSCNRCGQVCPTQSIRPLNLEERRYAKVGTAVINRELCLVWEREKLCLVCDERCPYNAIIFKVEKGMRRPFVLENKCNGCGLCEEVCPVEGESAIVIYPLGEVRLKKGSYIEVARRSELKLEKDEGLDEILPSPLTLLPERVGGWKKTEEFQIYHRQNLFNYLNGAAEFYLSHNFQKLLIQNYNKNGKTITVELYQMDSPSNASRVFLHDTQEETFQTDTDMIYSYGFLKFWKEEFYVKVFILLKGDKLKREILAIGEAIKIKIEER